MVERGRRRLATRTWPEESGDDRRSPAVPVRPIAWHRRPWVVGLATAASVLAAVAVFERARDRGAGAMAGWGWSRPGALPEGG